MNMKPGGKLGYQIPRPEEGSKMTALCLAPVFDGVPHQHYPAIGRDGKDYTLKVGDVQRFQFTEDCAPPQFDEVELQRYGTGEGPIDDDDTPVGRYGYRRGYIGMAKGMKMVAWERGLYRPGAKADDVKAVLKECEDFRTEWSHIQKVVQDRGHILLCSPKGHCELAGVGIEYCWGKSKQHFRKYNDCKTANLHKNIEASLAPSNLGLDRVRRFARKTREYKRAYVGMDALSFAKIQKFIKTCRSHRSALDLDLGFLNRS